jgi:tetratricopeptide (TPR) repeat protein
MVESVAWITERKNTLSLLFYLASMNAYLRFARIDAHNETHPTDWRAYAISLAFFLCALGSKTVTATLPAALLLILWWKHRLHRRRLALLVPFFLLGIAAAWHTSFLERSEVGASGPEWSYTAPQRILIATRAICFYAAKLLWPANLSFIYPKWRIDETDPSQWLFPLALLVILALLFILRHRIGRGPLVAILFFIGTLVPALGFVNVYPMRYTFVADHYQYHASLGLIALATAAISTLLHRRNLNRRFPRAAAGAVALLLLPLPILTFMRARDYRDPKTLWTDTLHKNPNSWMAWLNFGHVAAAASPDLSAAADAYRKALALAPNVADPHFNIGLIHLAQQDYPAAAAEFTRAIALNPRHAGAHDMLGLCLVAQHQREASIAHYRLTLAIKPRYANAHFNLGVALRDTGQLNDAAAEFTAAIELDPTNALALRELANCRIHQKTYAAAIDPLQRLLQLQPNNAEAHFDLAAALALTNHPEESNDHLRKALAIKPELQSRRKK